LPSGAADQKGAAVLKADTVSIDVPSDSYLAKGAVRVVRGGMSLLADSMIYHTISGDAQAEGGIFLENGSDTLKGDRLSLNLFSQQGELSNAELFVKSSNFRVRSKLMEKTGEEDYRMERGSFTTCDGENPSWRFEARKVEVTLDEFATARDAVFYVGDIPLLYTPYLLFPVNKERQSGLLIPKFGHSSKKGVYLDLPYYWAISPSQDVTFDFDMETSRGAGVGADYRYLRGNGGEGRLQTFGIYDTQVNKFRGELNEKHLELLSPSTTVAADIHLITDRSYYKDYGEFAGDYNRQLLESTASFGHRWERYGLSGEVRYAEDLVAPDNKATMQRLPALGFTAAGEKLGPFFWSMDSGFINFQRTQGETGERLDLHPRLTLYEKPTSALDLSLYGGFQQRFYNSYGTDAPGGLQQIGQADAGGTLSLPLERVYDGRVRHLLVPSIEYGFVQQKSNEALPLFDYGDRVLGQSIAKWSISNVVTGKFTQEGGDTDYRDLVYLKLSQGYQFSGQRRDLLTFLDVDQGHHLTDLMLESRITPVKGLGIDLDGRYNPIDGNLSTANLGVDFKGEGTNAAFLGYRFSRDEVDYLEGRFTFPIAKQLSASVLGRYSFDKGGFLESRYSLEYKLQCWSVIATYADRVGSTLNPGNQEFTLNFTLAGIGALGPVRAY
jgi:LPS-assembly protein